jgi:heparosan-N-sulfate-glucuronate 5-epimerase
MSLKGRLRYYQRIFAAYLTRSKSHLTFWHGEPQVNEQSNPGQLGQYYMPFLAKADYPGHYDAQGIPMLDYHGAVGLQYNPIAIAQYGLGNYNLYCSTGEEERKCKFLTVADWLVDNLEDTPQGTRVWNHHFDWEYRTPVKAPWYSALSQGQGISLLVRTHQETRNSRYLDAARDAFYTFQHDMHEGGVIYTDDRGYIWFEEAIVDPPTHILNGFLWASWGVYDYFLHTKDEEARRLFDEAVRTLRDNLSAFEAGFWSLYEQSGTRMKMLASPFYHSLHIVQLRVMHRLTGETAFAQYADRWDAYRRSFVKRNLALGYKALFKLLYY